MQDLIEFNIERTTEKILTLKEELNKNITELKKYGITLDDIFKEMEGK